MIAVPHRTLVSGLAYLKARRELGSSKQAQRVYGLRFCANLTVFNANNTVKAAIAPSFILRALVKDPYIHIESLNVGESRYLCGIDPEKVSVGIDRTMVSEFPAALICDICRAIHEVEVKFKARSVVTPKSG